MGSIQMSSKRQPCVDHARPGDAGAGSPIRSRGRPGMPRPGRAKPDGSDELVPGSGETANRVNTQNELCVGGWVRRTPTNEVGQAPSRAVPS
jgi:hypothetical protein